MEVGDLLHNGVEFHSHITLRDEILPLWKLPVRPYHYYLQYSFTSNLSRLLFYQELAAMSHLIIAPEGITTKPISQSYFQQWLGLSQKNQFYIGFFLKYCNFTLKEWMHQQKQCSSIISEQVILMILKQLLSLHKNYYEVYQQCCQIFKSHLIYITTEKTLRIYPHHFAYRGQIAANRLTQAQLSQSKGKLDKFVSIQTTLSSSRVGESLPLPVVLELQLKEDLRDIFILALQLVSLKNYEHFYNKKHSLIIWDSVNNTLNSIENSHLSADLLGLLKQCAQNKYFQAEWMLMRIERIMENQEKNCKSIYMHKNQELVQKRQKEMEQEKQRRLSGLSFGGVQGPSRT